jgi:hypothetical protein
MFQLTPDAALGVIDMFDYLKKKFKKEQEQPGQVPPKAPPTPRTKKAEPPAKSEKELATEAGEPYVTILSMDVDPENIHAGSFELDWNEKFVANLIRAGYVGKTHEDIVDQWFQNVCRHVVMETWEQEQAMNPDPNSQRFTRSRDLGNGRTEIS